MNRKLKEKKLEIARKMVPWQKNVQNSKYGKLVLQTNEVQFKLVISIILNASLPDKKYSKQLSGMTLGSLITIFQSCCPIIEKNFISKLKAYNTNRNRLAHKMYSTEKLTVGDCESTLVAGEVILQILNQLIK